MPGSGHDSSLSQPWEGPAAPDLGASTQSPVLDLLWGLGQDTSLTGLHFPTLSNKEASAGLETMDPKVRKISLPPKGRGVLLHTGQTSGLLVLTD